MALQSYPSVLRHKCLETIPKYSVPLRKVFSQCLFWGGPQKVIFLWKVYCFDPFAVAKYSFFVHDCTVFYWGFLWIIYAGLWFFYQRFSWSFWPVFVRLNGISFMLDKPVFAHRPWFVDLKILRLRESYLLFLPMYCARSFPSHCFFWEKGSNA